MNCEDCVKIYEKDNEEPPCDGCYVKLDEGNTEAVNIYFLVRDQIRVAPMGEVVGLDYGTVLDVIKLYAIDGDVKKIFEDVLTCHRIEQEFRETGQ